MLPSCEQSSSPQASSQQQLSNTCALRRWVLSRQTEAPQHPAQSPCGPGPGTHAPGRRLR